MAALYSGFACLALIPTRRVDISSLSRCFQPEVLFSNAGKRAEGKLMLALAIFACFGEFNCFVS